GRKTAPTKPTVKAVDNNTTKVTRKAEAGSTITFKMGNTALGKAKSNSSGKFTVTMTRKKSR
ncbi:Ig-like domain-containing protein, partial [Peribacillus sp. NPDC060186]